MGRLAGTRAHHRRRPPASSQVAGPLRCHVARLRDDEVTAVGEILVTDVGRTCLDLARSLPFEAAVVTLDAALHEGLVTRELIETRLFDIAGTRGSRHAARVVLFADGRSESVGESRSRVALRDLGLAPSALQFEIRTSSGLLVGRTDFAWEEERVVGEFDGRIKYGRLLRPGQDAGDAVFEEKRREDAIRAEDWDFVRWTWSDLSPPTRLGERAQAGPRARCSAPLLTPIAGVVRRLPVSQHRQSLNNTRNGTRSRQRASEREVLQHLGHQAAIAERSDRSGSRARTAGGPSAPRSPR